MEARGFAPPPHDGFALLAALLRKMRLLILLSASGESHANFTSESQCLGAGLPLFTDLPRRLILGNPYPYTRMLMRYRGVCERACSASFLEEFFSETRLPVFGVLGIPRS